MCRKLIFLVSFVGVLGLLNGASADTITWTGEAADNNSWCDGDNWDGGDVPGSGDTALIDWTSPERGPIIGGVCNAKVLLIQGPEPNFGMVQVMDVNTSGTVETDSWVWRRDVEGVGTGTAIININGSPTITINDLWRGTDNGISIVNIDGDPCIIVTGAYRGGDNSGWFCTNMSGGYFEIGVEFIIGDNGGGEINMSGGTIVVDHLGMGGDRGTAALIINMTGGLILVEGEFMFPGSAGRAGNTWMNLDGGVMDCNEFLHGGENVGNPTYTDDWRVDIEQGVLKIRGDVVDIIDANVIAGQITAYDDEGTVVVVYDDVNDKTVVSGLPPDPNTATDPNPGNRSTGVDPNVVLSWTAGVNATDHLVFFGTSWDDVETMTDPCAVKLLGDETYDPNGSGPLLLGTTYYWRVDANNPTTTWTGRIWSFTVKSPIVDPNMWVHYKFDEPNGIVAYDSSGREYHGAVDGNELLWDPNNGHRDGCRIFDDDGDEETLVDVPAAVTSTIDAGITISVWLKDSYNNDEENWVCTIGAGGEGAPYHLLVDVGGGYERAYFRAGDDSCDVLTWNLDGRNARDIEGWHHWAFVKDENIDTMSMYFDGELKATKTATHDTLANLQNTTFKIGGLTWEYYAYAGKIDEFKVFDYGKSAKEVQALFREEGLEFAWAPHPFNGEKEVDYDVVCTWSPGDYADSHDVYFGTSWDDISDVNSSNLASYPNVDYNHTDACSYDPPGLLDLGQLYYWRVDEVNDSNNDTWKGRVWKFTVAEYITIDDMEDYGAMSEGWWYGADTWSGGELILQTVPPVRGEQSMKFMYYNLGPDWGMGYFSEAQTKDLEPNNWTEFDLKRLSLWFYGDSDNAASGVEQMYVLLEDYDGNTAEVRYGDGEDEDVNDITIEQWQEWTILLSSLNDANLADPCYLAIGFGQRWDMFAGGWGYVYFDDIRLYPSVCVPERRKPAADLNNDCIVNFKDAEIMAGEWLEVDVNLGQVQAPKDANLVGWWKLDEGSGSVAADSSGSYNNPGTIEVLDVNVFWVAGHDGNALEFDGGRVRVPDAQELRPMDQVSVCAWVYYSDRQDSGRVVVKGADDKECYEIEISDYDSLVFHVRDGNDYDVADKSYERYPAESNEDMLDRDEWMHVAGTYDGNVIKCYINGEVADVCDTQNAILYLCQDTNDLAIGNMSDDDRAPFKGTIDDVRVYDYGLSEEEIRYIATDGIKIFTVQSVANLYNEEDLGKRAVNFRDFAVIADGWLEKKLWPE